VVTICRLQITQQILSCLRQPGNGSNLFFDAQSLHRAT